MKNLIRLFFTFLVVGTISSCEKKVEVISYEGGTPPVLTADRSVIALSFVNKDNIGLKLIWTNPDYKFTTGLSSQDVSYLLEIGKDGTNFSPVKQLSVAKDLTYTFTQGELNDYLLNTLNLTPAVAASVQFRVTSTLLNNTIPLSSNVLKFVLTPFAIPPKVTPPASDALFLVGSATPGGWNNPVPVPSQQFTRTNATFYTITIALIGGQSYLFLPVNGDWSAKFGGLGANNGNNPNGDDFKPNGGDILAPTASGNYKIDVDFQKGKFTLTKL
jgi:starch-binding outer membrane protein SusE/F